MKEEILRQIHITMSYDEYRNFFSDDWVERAQQLADGKVKLSEAVFDLSMAWRAAAYTASLPVAIIEHMKAYHDAFVNTGELNTTLLRLAEILPARLAREMPVLTVDPGNIRRLQAKIVEIGAQFEEQRDKSEFDFPVEDTWRSYCEEDAYRLSLWGSQRICFVAIYNAYEDFILRVTSVPNALDNIRSNDDRFKREFIDSFGKSLWDKCWKAENVKVAREARHSLSHAGGRLTENLGKLRHGFVVKDDRIQILPENTRALFSVLKDCAYSLVERAATMSSFT